jgi:replicative DNA helicase
MSNAHDIIYTPSEIASIGTKYLEQRKNKENAGIAVGIPSFDKDFLPLLPGELLSIIARPGNGKTGFMMRWARHRAAQLQAEGDQNKIVIYCTWEQSIEELHAFDVAADTQISITDMARGNISEEAWPLILSSSMRRVGKPVWFIGHSMERRKRRPRISITDLGDALTAIEAWDEERYKIDMVFLDYLQRIPFDGKPESKTVGMDENLNRLKDGALAFGCPFVVGVQARREVDQRDSPVPLMDDGQWSSAIEQVSDKSISLVRPRKYKQDGDTFGKGPNAVQVQGENQLLIALLKQKLGVANKVYWAMFNPIYNQLDEAEVRNVNLNQDWTE